LWDRTGTRLRASLRYQGLTPVGMAAESRGGDGVSAGAVVPHVHDLLLMQGEDVEDLPTELDPTHLIELRPANSQHHLLATVDQLQSVDAELGLPEMAKDRQDVVPVSADQPVADPLPDDVGSQPGRNSGQVPTAERVYEVVEDIPRFS